MIACETCNAICAYGILIYLAMAALVLVGLSILDAMKARSPAARKIIRTIVAYIGNREP